MALFFQAFEYNLRMGCVNSVNNFTVNQGKYQENKCLQSKINFQAVEVNTMWKRVVMAKCDSHLIQMKLLQIFQPAIKSRQLATEFRYGFS